MTDRYHPLLPEEGGCSEQSYNHSEVRTIIQAQIKKKMLQVTFKNKINNLYNKLPIRPKGNYYVSQLSVEQIQLGLVNHIPECAETPSPSQKAYKTLLGPLLTQIGIF